MRFEQTNRSPPNFFILVVGGYSSTSAKALFSKLWAGGTRGGKGGGGGGGGRGGGVVTATVCAFPLVVNVAQRTRLSLILGYIIDSYVRSLYAVMVVLAAIVFRKHEFIF